ncbi:MAG: hypothetical protein BWX56_00854 [Euryarchaeota archaeon ADurb.Bin023]|nr:MAG: hypothetical protein BWX56_00854 [Euryarchaeota archaeon ADurb.Bin023]
MNPFPTYYYKTIVSNPAIYGPLSKKYGINNIYWPIVWSDSTQIKMYTYEINDLCKTNSHLSNSLKFPVSNLRIGSHLVDYTAFPRTITPSNSLLIPSINSVYDCSLDYSTTKICKYYTCDIDYMWDKDNQRRSLELTTFDVPFKNIKIALKVVSQINKRDTWKWGPHAMLRQVEASNDLGCDKYTLACVNTIEKGSNTIDTSGNALWFDLDTDIVKLLYAGELPSNLNFGKFSDLLKSL